MNWSNLLLRMQVPQKRISHDKISNRIYTVASLLLKNCKPHIPVELRERLKVPPSLASRFQKIKQYSLILFNCGLLIGLIVTKLL